MKKSRTATGTPRQAQVPPAHIVTPLEEEPLDQPVEAPRYHTFTVRFLVDPMKACRRTEVTYVQGGASEAWQGCDQAQVAQWIANHLPQLEADVPEAPPEVAIALHDLGLVGDDGKTHQLVRTNQAFVLRFRLALAGKDGRDIALPYTATAYAQHLAGDCVIVGTAQGTVTASAATTVAIAGSLGRPGTYRLEVKVCLDAPLNLDETLIGDLIEVYAGSVDEEGGLIRTGTTACT